MSRIDGLIREVESTADNAFRTGPPAGNRPEGMPPLA
jgi:hypothetical protein